VLAENALEGVVGSSDMIEHIAPAFEGVAPREMGLQHGSGACAHCGGAPNVARKVNRRCRAGNVSAMAAVRVAG
jgi:hypothetical protein